VRRLWAELADQLQGIFADVDFYQNLQCRRF